MNYELNSGKLIFMITVLIMAACTFILITAALLILMLTLYSSRNFIFYKTCIYTLVIVYYHIKKKYPQSCLSVLGLGTVNFCYVELNSRFS